MERRDVRKNLRRGVYIVPTLFTVLNIFFGFRSIVNSMRAVQAMTAGQTDRAITFFEIACVSLLIAAIFDTFDGLAARQLGATSEFGKEYDSLADVVTFGCAPAVLVYAWGLQPLGKLGVGIAFLFLVSVSLRLARFNVMHGKSDYRYFVGLPSPAGALTIGAIIYYAPAPVLDRRFAIVILILTACTAFAMVSPIRWRAGKGINFQKGRPLMVVVVIAAIIAVGFAWPRPVGLGLAIAYLASGPMMRLWSIAFPPRKTDDVLQIAPQ
ncbi:MAG TPA: CDP-diacylglycerol--serine O-phosphatidyltransferase [Thermoanaerobaculia bacterium]